MGLQIAGRNLDIGDALRGRAEAQIRASVAKYFDGGFHGHVTIEREGSGFRTEITIHLDTGVVLHAEAAAMDATLSFEGAAERIEKRLRRYKRRLRDKQHEQRGEAVDAASYVLAPVGEEDEPEIPDNPVIIAEKITALRTLTVGGAVMALDLTDAPLVVFRHAGSGAVNVVYRRSDGNIGWIDPAAAPRPARG
jgi:ribosomal subunit interface protein